MDDSGETSHRPAKFEENTSFTEKLSLPQRWWQVLNLIAILHCKTSMTVLRKYRYVLAVYLGITALFLTGVTILRFFYSHNPKSLTIRRVDYDFQIGRDWILSSNVTRKRPVVLIGYAPRLPLIEALMEEAERILVRNGYPFGVTEYQTVPFESEYSMATFHTRHPHTLNYAFAFDTPTLRRGKLSTTLGLISYIRDRGCFIDHYPPCPGNVYIAQVIMEAFINAHTGRENNVTLHYRGVREAFKYRDQIYDDTAELALSSLYALCLVFLTCSIVYPMAAERERGIQVTLNRMGLSEVLNITANITSALPHIMAILIITGIILSIPLLDSGPIISHIQVKYRLLFSLCYAFSLISYCVLGSVLFPKAHQCVIMTCCLFAIGGFLDDYWYPPTAIKYAISVLAVVGTQRGILSFLYMEENGLKWESISWVFSKHPDTLTPKTQMVILLVSVPVQLLVAVFFVYFRSSKRLILLEASRRLYSTLPTMPESPFPLRQVLESFHGYWR
ncbi:ATP-binding cassette sub-family a member 2 [Plakobranchus ocellatus]|uniref:ATP-binding cassette sub-family a member 2 n=1 Tax=Plakobranchus ocellatus TaxID=259542 RepID=A0AAV4DMI6_9GAST|nr:ATP-binding cassette sub-family a member 2 [Plakobranchus ocellatus]